MHINQGIKDHFADAIPLICNSFRFLWYSRFSPKYSGAESNLVTATKLNAPLGLDASLNELQLKNWSISSGAQSMFIFSAWHYVFTWLDNTKSGHGSRTWDTEVLERLLPQYAKVSAEKGPGMFKRMKVV